MKVIRETSSVCPVCLKRIPACLKTDGSDVFIEKHCQEHGSFSVVTWRGRPALIEWTGPLAPFEPADNCPQLCGLCGGHQQSTCCLLLEVTNRCNLTCPHCFAGSRADHRLADPPLPEVKQWIADIAATGQAFLQLSGGEPTLRDDLPDIVKYAKDAGCEYVQLNSNGLRLAADESLVRRLAEAGLSFVFMQFDGTDDGIYEKLRGAPLLAEKIKAIELCGQYNLGVTLVPTVVPGVNDHDLGNIIRLGVDFSPVVRGVHFQPISYFGQNTEVQPDAARITLAEILRAAYGQTGNLVPEGSLAASRCDHPRCGCHGAYVVMPGGVLRSYAAAKESGCCRPKTTGENNRHFVGLRWRRQRGDGCSESQHIAPETMTILESLDIKTLDGFLARAKSHSFTISAMAFQDLYTLDLERLSRCSLHVYDRGQKVPFCAYYNLKSRQSR